MRVLIVVGLTAVYAACFVVIKAGLAYAPPLAFAGLRLVVAGVALLGLVVVARQPLLPPPRQWPWILALALTVTAASYGAMFVSPSRAGVGIASVLGNLQPVFVVALAAVVLDERMSGSDWVVLGLGVLGAVLIAFPALRGGDAYGLSGAALALASSLGFAAGSVLFKRLDPPSGLLTITAWQLVVGGLPLLAISAVVERGAAVTWTAAFLALLLFLALVGTALVTAVWYWLVQREDVGRLTMFFFLVPVFGLALAAAVDGADVGRSEVVGVGLIVAGVGVAIAQSWRDTTPPSTRRRPASAGAPNRP